MLFRFRPGLCGGVLAALLALGGAGCNDQTYTWVGPAFDVSTGDGGDALAAITVQNGEVRAYLCGGATTFAALSRWYDGRVADSDSFEATADDGSYVQGWVGDDYAYADFQAVGGGTFSLGASPAEDELSGLYAVEDAGCRTGVVVMANPSGGDPLVQGTWCDDQDHFAQVTPVTPFERSERGLHVQVDLGAIGLAGGIRDLYVTKDAVR